jgi:hypothetical protein
MEIDFQLHREILNIAFVMFSLAQCFFISVLALVQKSCPCTDGQDNKGAGLENF